MIKCKCKCIHNIAFSSEKVISSESGEKYAQIKQCSQAKIVQNSSKQICWDRLWTTKLARSDNLKVKHLYDGFSSYKHAAFHFTQHQLMAWSRVDYYDVFISCLHSHSDGTHSLQRIHWWESDMMVNFSKSVLMKRQNHLHLGWPEGESIFSRFLLLGELFLLGNILFLFRFIHHSTHSWKKYAVDLIQSKYFPDNIFQIIFSAELGSRRATTYSLWL